MSLEAVAGFLEIPARDVWRIAAGLATGGVLSEVDTERLAVNPQVLRSALLRQLFLTESPIRLDYRKLLPLVPSITESVEEIVAARAYGAVVPTADLHELVLQSGSRRAWSTLAVVSEEDARWVLENYPDDLLNVASMLAAPDPASGHSKLLERAAEPTKKTEGWSLPEQPMRHSLVLGRGLLGRVRRNGFGADGWWLGPPRNSFSKEEIEGLAFMRFALP